MNKTHAMHSMFRLATCGLICALLGPQASSQVLLEDFESGDHGGYTLVGLVDRIEYTAAAAHDGLLGGEFEGPSSAWYYRTDRTAGPGQRLRAFVRTSGASDGLMSLGFAAGPFGCWSASARFNGSTLELAQNFQYGHTPMASVPMQWTALTWYQIEVEWHTDGDITLNVYDESGSNQLATTGPFPAGLTVAGGIGFRGASINFARNQIDTITRFDGAGAAFCSATPNSGGTPASLSATGSPVVAEQDLTLVVEGLPAPGTAGLFYFGPNQVQIPFGDGLRCVGGVTQRVYPLASADASRAVSYPLNFNAGYGTQFTPGSSVHFQFWYRDPMMNASGFNLTDGWSVSFQ